MNRPRKPRRTSSTKPPAKDVEQLARLVLLAGKQAELRGRLLAHSAGLLDLVADLLQAAAELDPHDGAGRLAVAAVHRARRLCSLP
jgi:hypothetical protein